MYIKKHKYDNTWNRWSFWWKTVQNEMDKRRSLILDVSGVRSGSHVVHGSGSFPVLSMPFLDVFPLEDQSNGQGQKGQHGDSYTDGDGRHEAIVMQLLSGHISVLKLAPEFIVVQVLYKGAGKLARRGTPRAKEKYKKGCHNFVSDRKDIFWRNLTVKSRITTPLWRDAKDCDKFLIQDTGRDNQSHIMRKV